MSRLVNVNLKLKDGRSIVVTVDEDKVEKFRNGPDKLLDALAQKYPHDLPIKPVYVNVQENNTITLVSEVDKPDSNSEDAHNSPVISGKDRRCQSGTFHWDREDVLTLIRLRSEKEPIYNQFGIRKKNVWAMIAEEFQAKGFNVTLGQCEQKWKNLTKNYRDTADYNYFTNTNRVCPFYKELSEVYVYDPKEKHASQQSGLNMPAFSGGSSGLGTNNNMPSTSVTSPEEFSSYPGMDTSIGSSGRPSENLVETFQHDPYLQEVTPDISGDALFQTSDIKPEIIDVHDDPVIVIHPSPPPPPPPPPMATTSVASLLSSNISSPNFQPCSVPQMTYATSNTSQSNIPSLSSILTSLSSPSSMMVSRAHSIVKQEPNTVTISPQYSPSVSNVAMQQQIPDSLQTQQISSSPQTAFSSLQSLPSHSSNHPNNPSSQMRKRPRVNTAFTSSSGSSVSDMLAYRRRLLRKTSFSMPNNMLDMLKQMNEERRREHRTLVNTLNQQHEDLLDLFKQHQQEYLHQEEIKQALLTELIERMSKN